MKDFSLLRKIMKSHDSVFARCVSEKVKSDGPTLEQKEVPFPLRSWVNSCGNLLQRHFVFGERNEIKWNSFNLSGLH